MGKDFRKHTDRILSKSMEKFGETVTFYPKSGGVFKVEAIFDNEAEALDLDTEQVLSVNNPRIGVNLNDLEFEVRQGDEVQVRDVRYKVHDKIEDGQGGATLELHKVRKRDRIPDTRIR